MSSDLTADERQQLKQWLVRELASISDADTDILADYVLALLNADAPEPELEKELHEQLTDFLEDHTVKFVTSFLATLRSKSYVDAFPLAAPAQGSSSSAPASVPFPHAPTQGSPLAGGAMPPTNAAAAGLAPSDRPAKRSRSTSPSSSAANPSAAKTSRLASPALSASSSHPPVAGFPGASPAEAGQPLQDGPRLPCFDYHQRGYCPRGAACIWEHDLPGGPPMMGMDGGGMMMPQPAGFPNGGRGSGFQGDRGGGMHDRGRGGGFQGGNMGPNGGGSGFIGGYVPPGGFDGPPQGSPSGSSSSPHHPGQGGPQGQPFFDPSMFMDPSFSMLQPNGLPIPGGPPGGGLVYPSHQGNGFGRGGFNGGGGRGGNFNNGPRGGGGGRGGGPNNGPSLRGGRNSMPDGAVRKPPKERNTLTLVVSAIPTTHCNLPSITEHFAKFGTVTNVAIDVRSSRALVSFATNEQAYKAWKSEEVIFGSRFVTILWHAPLAGHGAKGQEALEKSKNAVASLVGGVSKEEALKKQLRLEGLIAKQRVLMKRLENTTAPEGKEDLMAQLRQVGKDMDAAKSDAPASAPVGSPAGAAASPVASGSRSVVFNKPGPSIPLTEEEQSAKLDRELAEGRMEGVEEGAEAASSSSSNATLLAMLAKRKAEAAALGLDASLGDAAAAFAPYYAPRGRGARGRGGVPRGGRGAYGAAPGRASMKLDLRTKSLAVVGDGLVNDEDARKAVETWYEDHGRGGVENVRVDDGEKRMVVTFKSRGAAEAALARGNNIVDLPTHVALSWYNAPPSIVAAPAAPKPADEDDGMGERR